MKKKTTTNQAYNNLSINTNKGKDLSCLVDVLDKYHAHLKDMTTKHSKVMQLRFDLRYPADGTITPDNEQLSNFSYNFQRKLQREKIEGGHKVDPRLILVTEQHDNSQHPHIHGTVLVNANAKQKAYPLYLEIERQWKQVLKTNSEGLVDRCNKQGENGIIINRNADDYQDKMNQCSHQASYLAKTRGKESNPKGSWLVKGTRVPKRDK